MEYSKNTRSLFFRETNRKNEKYVETEWSGFRVFCRAPVDMYMKKKKMEKGIIGIE